MVGGVPAGAFTLTVVADGLAPGSLSGTIEAGKMFMTPEFALRIATANVDVDAMSQSEVAQLQVRQEEKQRIVGAIPNFYVTYDWNAVPLNARQKVELAEKTQIDPVNFVLIGATAGIEQAQNSLSGYGPGAMGASVRRMRTSLSGTCWAERFCRSSSGRTRATSIRERAACGCAGSMRCLPR